MAVERLNQRPREEYRAERRAGEDQRSFATIVPRLAQSTHAEQQQWQEL